MIGLTKTTIRQRFNRIAKQYACASVLPSEILQRLLARFDIMKINPDRLLDFGAREGAARQGLRQRFPKASIVSYECSECLLHQFSRRWYQRAAPRVCGSYEQLPFKDRTFEVIFSNLTLHWLNDLPLLLREWHRLLKPGGLLLFSTFGPDTLKELRTSFAAHSQYSHIHDFMDMHDIGDALIRAHFENPVMDMEYIQMRYQGISELFQDLKSMGATNARLDRRKGLMGKEQWQRIKQDYFERWGLLEKSVPATAEIIYGHAWMPATFREEGEIRVPLSSIAYR